MNLFAGIETIGILVLLTLYDNITDLLSATAISVGDGSPEERGIFCFNSGAAILRS